MGKGEQVLSSHQNVIPISRVAMNIFNCPLIIKRARHFITIRRYFFFLFLASRPLPSIKFCWYIFVRFVGHVTKLVLIRLGEPKEGQQHHNSAVDLPSNQLTTYQRNLHITNTTCRATRYGWTDTN